MKNRCDDERRAVMNRKRKIRKLLLWGVFIFVVGGIGMSHTAAQSAAQCVVPPSGLISWWPGDGNALDIQDGNDGTLVGGAGFVTGKVGQAFSFNNMDAFVDFPTAGFSTAAMTIDLWVNMTSWAGFDDIVQHATDGMDQNRISLERGNGLTGCIGDNNKLMFITSDANSSFSILCTTTAFSLNTWFHIAATFDSSGKTEIYVNGDLEASATGQNVPSDIDTRFFVGRNFSNDTSRLFHGLIDEVGIYNHVLSAAEILAIFTADSAGKCKPGAPPVQVTQVTVDLYPDIFRVEYVDEYKEAEESKEEAYLLAFIEPPADLHAVDIVAETVTLSINGLGLAMAEECPMPPPGLDYGDVLCVLFPLDPANVSDLLGVEVTEVEVGDEEIEVKTNDDPVQQIDLIELTVSGLIDGREFSGTDAVMQIPGVPRQGHSDEHRQNRRH